MPSDSVQSQPVYAQPEEPNPAPLAERLADVAHHDEIVHACLTYARAHRLDDREALIWMVKNLAVERARLLKVASDAIARTPFAGKVTL